MKVNIVYGDVKYRKGRFRKMKVKGKLVSFGVLLVFGFVLGSCATLKDPGAAPELVGLYMGFHPDVGQITEFTTTDEINFYTSGRDQDRNVRKFVALCKNSEGVVTLNNTWNIPINSTSFDQGIGWFNLPTGNYTFEVYVVDSKNNTSNTLSTNFTVK
jgi:hypothetical protein